MNLRDKEITSRDIKKIVGKDYIKIISKLINTRWAITLKPFKRGYYLLDAEEKSLRYYWSMIEIKNMGKALSIAIVIKK